MPKKENNNSISVLKQKLKTDKLWETNIEFLCKTWHARIRYEKAEIKSSNLHSDFLYEAQQAHESFQFNLSRLMDNYELRTSYHKYFPEYKQRLSADSTLKAAKATLDKDLEKKKIKEPAYSYNAIMHKRKNDTSAIQVINAWKLTVDLKKLVDELEKESLKEELNSLQIANLSNRINSQDLELQQKKNSLDPQYLTTYTVGLKKYMKKNVHDDDKTNRKSIWEVLRQSLSFRHPIKPNVKIGDEVEQVYSLYEQAMHASPSEAQGLAKIYDTAYYKLTEEQQSKFHEKVKPLTQQAETDRSLAIEDTKSDPMQADPFNAWDAPTSSYLYTNANPIMQANAFQEICSLYQQMYDADSKGREDCNEQYNTLYHQLTEDDRDRFYIWTQHFLTEKQQEMSADASGEDSLKAEDVFEIYNDLMKNLDNPEINSRYQSALKLLATNKIEESKFNHMISHGYTRSQPWKQSMTGSKATLFRPNEETDGSSLASNSVTHRMINIPRQQS